MLRILAENLGTDIIVIGMRFLGQLFVAFDQVQIGAADFSGNRIAVKLIIQGIDLVVIVIITEFVVCSFHKFYTIIVK